MAGIFSFNIQKYTQYTLSSITSIVFREKLFFIKHYQETALNRSDKDLGIVKPRSGLESSNFWENPDAWKTRQPATSGRWVQIIAEQKNIYFSCSLNYSLYLMIRGQTILLMNYLFCFYWIVHFSLSLKRFFYNLFKIKMQSNFHKCK